MERHDDRYDDVLDLWIKFGGHVALWGVFIIVVLAILMSDPSPD